VTPKQFFIITKHRKYKCDSTQMLSLLILNYTVNIVNVKQINCQSLTVSHGLLQFNNQCCLTSKLATRRFHSTTGLRLVPIFDA